MPSFKSLPRADIERIENEHDIYRVFKIPGKRNSRFYSGSGVEKTYNLSACEEDKDLPDDDEAVPSLKEKEVGDGVVQRVIRKDVTYLTLQCPECEVEGRFNSRKSERFCPECGMLLGRGNAKKTEDIDAFGIGDKLERTAAAAGRYKGEG